MSRRSNSITATAATATAKPSTLQALRNRNFAMGLGGGFLLAGLHSATGSSNDFYDYRFKSKKDPDDLASFYGGEELMVCHLSMVFIILAIWGSFSLVKKMDTSLHFLLVEFLLVRK